MERKVKLVAVWPDFVSKKTNITLEFEGLPPEGMETAFQDTVLKMTLVKYRQKRSLDANAYYWKLVTEIAEAVKSSKTEVHNQLLSDYGQLEMADGSVVSVMLKEEIDWKKVTQLHLRPTVNVMENSKGTLFRCYLVVRGSHTYDSREMSVLIKGAAEEARQLGIETLTPDELQRIINETKKEKRTD